MSICLPTISSRTLLHFVEQGAAHEVDADVAFEKDVEPAGNHQVANGVGPLGAGVEGVVEEEDDLDPVPGLEQLDFPDDVFRAAHPHMAAPVHRGGAERTIERTSAAGHDVGRGQEAVARDFECKIVFFEGDEMVGGERQGVEVGDGRPGRIGDDATVLPEDDSPDVVEGPKVGLRLPPAADFEHGFLALAPDDEVEFGNMLEAILGGHGGMGTAQDGQRPGVGFFGQSDEAKGLEPVFRRDRHSDDIRLVGPDLAFDIVPIQPENVGRDDFDGDSLSLQDGPDREQSQRRHRRTLGPALGEIAAGRNVELDFKRQVRTPFSFRISWRRSGSRWVLPWLSRRCNRPLPWSCSCE
jgi:hypothetical protein